jgi:hypothetical protein
MSKQATELRRALLDGGAPGLHCFTVNKATATLEVRANLGIEGARQLVDAARPRRAVFRCLAGLQRMTSMTQRRVSAGASGERFQVLRHHIL